MSKCRVYYKPDKSVAIVHLSPKSKLTEEEGYAKCARESGLESLPYDDIDSSELPQTREDRGAWEGEKGKGISVNQIKAQQSRDEKKRKRKIEEEKEKLAIESLIAKGEL